MKNKLFFCLTLLLSAAAYGQHSVTLTCMPPSGFSATAYQFYRWQPGQYWTSQAYILVSQASPTYTDLGTSAISPPISGASSVLTANSQWVYACVAFNMTGYPKTPYAATELSQTVAVTIPTTVQSPPQPPTNLKVVPQ